MASGVTVRKPISKKNHLRPTTENTTFLIIMYHLDGCVDVDPPGSDCVHLGCLCMQLGLMRSVDENTVRLDLCRLSQKLDMGSKLELGHCSVNPAI